MPVLGFFLHSDFLFCPTKKVKFPPKKKQWSKVPYGCICSAAFNFNFITSTYSNILYCNTVHQ